jgi:DNA-binding transcriptional LysR family regulator
MKDLQLTDSSLRPSSIELRQWRQFVAVAEELHFGRAARRLHMTQPPLTQAIAQLEKSLEVRLFERTKRSVELSATGLALLPHARDLLARSQALPALARAAANGEVGRLRLGFVSTAGFDLLPQWIRAFRARCPGVALELLEATGDMQLTAFARGDMDAGVLLHSPGFAPAGLSRLGVAEEPLWLALPSQHRLTAHERLPLAEVLKEPLVIFPRRILPSVYDAVLGLYHASGQTPHIAQEAIQMQTIVNLVSAGLGVAWVPQSVRQFQRQGVVYREVKGRAGMPVPLCQTSLVWPTDAQNPCVMHFADALFPVADSV